jgi:hypothetical protein
VPRNLRCRFEPGNRFGELLQVIQRVPAVEFRQRDEGVLRILLRDRQKGIGRFPVIAVVEVARGDVEPGLGCPGTVGTFGNPPEQFERLSRLSLDLVGPCQSVLGIIKERSLRILLKVLLEALDGILGIIEPELDLAQIDPGPFGQPVIFVGIEEGPQVLSGLFVLAQEIAGFSETVLGEGRSGCSSASWRN